MLFAFTQLQGQPMSLSQFEILGGCGITRKWRRSVNVNDTGKTISLGEWMDKHAENPGKGLPVQSYHRFGRGSSTSEATRSLDATPGPAAAAGFGVGQQSQRVEPSAWVQVGRERMDAVLLRQDVPSSSSTRSAVIQQQHSQFVMQGPAPASLSAAAAGSGAATAGGVHGSLLIAEALGTGSLDNITTVAPASVGGQPQPHTKVR